MQNAKPYNHWSLAETRCLMNSIKNYKNRKINWVQIQQKLPNRTVLQCKSFFHNYTKKYELLFLLSRYDIVKVAHKLLDFCTYNETINNITDPRQRQYMNDLEVDFLLNIYQLQLDCTSFAFNYQLLWLLQEMILAYNKLMSDCPYQLSTLLLKQDQIDSLKSFMKSINSEYLLKKLQSLFTK
ncbi:SANT/Myb_domain [Hexamita inflata]|uniref:SANT/Myb domain n=1 Tax=Hexamita inflata TaxID=28002 RepID=A0AA86UYD3_9EUKA|nr:SANT/Myb domain [Hexamita inflata]